MNLKKKEKEQAAPEKNLEPAAAAVNSTSTTGFPVFNNSCNSMRWVSVISRFVRQLLSILLLSRNG